LFIFDREDFIMYFHCYEKLFMSGHFYWFFYNYCIGFSTLICTVNHLKKNELRNESILYLNNDDST